jgi:hypothetical protein
MELVNSQSTLTNNDESNTPKQAVELVFLRSSDKELRLPLKRMESFNPFEGL